jgi:hypothetical protein
MNETLKNIFVVCICIALAVLGYLFITGSSSSGVDVASSSSRDELIAKTQDFISRSAQLQSITLDQSIFTEPAFLGLRSFSNEVPDQPVGRTNIFTDRQDSSETEVESTP